MLNLKSRFESIILFAIIFLVIIPLSKKAAETAGENSLCKTEKQNKIDRLFQMSLEELMNVRITTAGKTSQRIADIPASVVLITRDEIETYGYRTLSEILENVPGLYGTNDYSEFGMNFGVRGFWSGVPNDNMIFLVNGMHQVLDFSSNYPMSKIFVPVEAIDRIEVIRGPMSVVYGAGAFYGVINIITNEPTSKPVSMVSFSAGNLKTKKIFARVAGKEGAFNYHVNASLYDTYGMDHALRHMVVSPALLPALLVPEDDGTGGKLENSETYFNFSGAVKGFSVNMSHSLGKREFYFAFPSVSDGSLYRISSTQISLGYKKDFSKSLTLEGKLSYSKSSTSFNYKILFDDFYGVQDLRTNAWELELNSFYRSGQSFEITTGLSYRSVFDISNIFDLPSFGVPFFENTQIFLADQNQVVTRALFSQIDYSPFKNLKLVAGIRLEQSPGYELELFKVLGAQVQDRSTALFDQDEVEIIPRFAVLYYLDENNVFKFLYGQATNRPSFAQNYQNTLLAGLEPLEPESIQTLEVNYIGTYSPRFSLNASIFRNVLKKLITRVVDFDEDRNYTSYSDNAGKMVTHGIELAISAEPIEYLRIELSGTYQQTDDKRREPTNYENIEVAYSPKFLGYLKASYCGVGFKAAITGNYAGAMETFWDETLDPQGRRIGDRVKGYFVLGANLRFDDLFMDGLFLNIRCSNIMDEEIRYPTFTNNDWATRGTIGYGRTFLVSLGYKF